MLKSWVVRLFDGPCAAGGHKDTSALKVGDDCLEEPNKGGNAHAEEAARHVELELKARLLVTSLAGGE